MTFHDDTETRANRLAQSRHEVSPFRHDVRSIRTFGLDLGASTLAPPQEPGWSQLVTLRTGIAIVACDNVQRIVTPEVALWVPDGCAYALSLRTRSQVRILYVRALRYAPRALEPVKQTALLRELIERAVTAGYLDPERGAHARLLDVMHDELAALVAEPAAQALVFPRTPAIRAAVERHLAAAEERSAVAALAAAAGMSARTLLRHFVNETGLPPREWLRRARLRAATIALASGASVTEAGLACGYASISAFIAAYQAFFGVTPGRSRHLAGRQIDVSAR